MRTAMRKPALIALAMLAAVPAARADSAKPAHPVLFSQTGRASYYDSALEGNATADGSIFDGDAFTAACRWAVPARSPT